MINEIKRRLDAGERVFIECTNRDAFISFEGGKYRNWNEQISSGIFEVAEIAVAGTNPCREVVVIKDCMVNILFDELKFFKIKESNFDNLIDKAIKAVRDYVAIITHLELDNITIESINYDLLSPLEIYREDTPEKIQKAIDWIDSLYTETFVIENERDIARIKKLAKITLENGNVVIAESDCLYYGDISHIKTTYGLMNFHLNFMTLKGATVTQKRGK